MCNISWFPPFALEGIRVHYSGTVTVCGEQIAKERFRTHNLRALVYLSNNSSCTVYTYTVCVWAVTDAGEGDPGCVNVNSTIGK